MENVEEAHSNLRKITVTFVFKKSFKSYREEPGVVANVCDHSALQSQTKVLL